MLYSARRYDEAIEFLKPLVAANPNFDHARSVLAWALIATGDLAGAEEQLRLVAEPGINQSNMGFLYAKLGRRDDALREIERLEMRAREGYGVAYDQTIIYAALGELDRVVRRWRARLTIIRCCSSGCGSIRASTRCAAGSALRMSKSASTHRMNEFWLTHTPAADP